MKFRVPEVFLGVFLTVAVLAVGMLFASSILPKPQSYTESQTGGENPAKESVKHGFWEKTADDPIAYFTLWLVGFTGVLAIATIGLGVATVLLYRAGKRQIGVAQRSADIAEASLTKLQRAFVTFQGMRYISHTGPDGKVWWSLHFNWLNSGATPAMKVRVFVSRYFEESDLPDDFEFDAPPDRPTNFMGPNSSIQSGGLSVTADDLIAVRENRKFLYFWGRVDYRDIFDGSPDHVTKFSMRAKDFRGDPAKEWDDKSNPVEIILDNSPARHNCADEDCNH